MGPRAVLVALLVAAAAGAPRRRLYNTTGGPVAGRVNVHLIAHSHDDVGWLKSPSDYFTGSRVIGIDAGGSGLSVYYANGAVQVIDWLSGHGAEPSGRPGEPAGAEPSGRCTCCLLHDDVRQRSDVLQHASLLPALLLQSGHRRYP